MYLLWQVSGWNPISREILGSVLLLVVALAAAAAALSASRRSASSPRIRSAWRWVTLALVGQILGQATQLIYEGVSVSDYPSLADPFYLSFYPFLLVGVLRFPVTRRARHEGIELALDSAIVTLGGGAVFVYLVLGPDLIAAHTLLASLVAAAYPIGDLILLVALGTVLLRETTEQARSVLRPMGLAIALFALADLAYGYIVLHGAYSAGNPVDTLYVLAFVCFVVAASRQDGAGEQTGERVSAAPVASASALWLPYLGITAAGSIAVIKEVGEPFFPDLSVALIVALIGYLVVARQAISQARLRSGNERLAQAQEIARLGSWEWDVGQDLVERSPVDLNLYGLDPRTPAMTKDEALSPLEPEDREQIERLVDRTLSDGTGFTCEVRVRRTDGELRTILTRGEAELHAQRVTCVRGTHQDITERKQMEIQLQHQADHDPLTGLLNRRRFAEELDRALHHCARYGRPGALLMLDLDNFKVLNDTRGHAAGDLALKALARVLRGRVRAEDVVARLGGDEFAVLLPEANEAQARAVGEEIRAEVAQSGLDPAVRITAGMVVFDGSQELSAENALIAADIALYEAKEAGKNQLQMFHGSAGAACTWVDRVRAALKEERLVLYGQPIFDLRHDVVTHNELLIRMLSESGEVISPGRSCRRRNASV